MGQTPVDVEHYKRLPGGSWQITALQSHGTIRFASLNVALLTSAIHQGVEQL